ncbi:MAG: DegT/DnrJ/EryC1/StrS family aminotransferase [Ruminococcus sp.]|nr:DegT/DnrJ/EryC1/StrS family aminotransferase [Ruminococcus sp.]
MKVSDRLDRQYNMYADEYLDAAKRVLESGWYILGNEVSSFEKEYAQYMGSKYCAALNSGLDALRLAVRALGIGKGDEVIVPANTFIATVMGVVEEGATPVFVEPDEYYCIDAGKIEAAITDKTKAVMVVHLYGQSADMGRICEIAKKHSLFVIEDCAQAHNSEFSGKKIGTWGDIGCFSFYPTKNLGAFGDSGAVITDNEDLANRIKTLRNYGSSIKYHNDLCGVNSRMDEIQAAFLRIKLTHLDELIAQRRKIAKMYLEGIDNSKIILPSLRDNATHVWHLFVVRCEERERLMSFLEDKGIHVQIHYPIPPHLQKCYEFLGHKEGEFPITEKYAKNVLSLPLFNGMTDEEVNYVIECINEF